VDVKNLISLLEKDDIVEVITDEKIDKAVKIFRESNTLSEFLKRLREEQFTEFEIGYLIAGML